MTGPIDCQIEDAKTVRLGTDLEFGSRFCVCRKTNPEITATRTTGFVTDPAADRNLPQRTVLLREDRHPDRGAEPIKRLPEGIDGIEKFPGIAITERRDTIGRDRAELIEN